MTDDWSAFEEEVAANDTPHPRYGCKVCKTLREVSPEERAVIEAVLGNPERSNASIYRAFRARGVLLDAERVGKHRRGDCR